MVKYKNILFIILFFASITFVRAQSIVLQIGATVPANSPWDLGLKKIAAEWASISGGRVKMAFPKSVSSSSPEDLIQKLKFTLDGIVLETTGMAFLDKDIAFLSMPNVIRNDAEYEKVMDVAIPIIKKRLEGRYELISTAKGGFVYIFSNQIIDSPDDLRKVRMGTDRKMEEISRLLQSMGIRTVAADHTSILLQFNSGALDAVYSSPLFIGALWSQYKRVISYMSAYPLAPFFGSIILNSKSWNRIPDDLKPRLIEAAERICKEIGVQSAKLEQEAIEAMKANGLKVPPVSLTNSKLWNDLYNEKLENEVVNWFSPDFVKSILRATGR